jgi:NADPH:quinone reductase-like Zn-dependent oxidoreductase
VNLLHVPDDFSLEPAAAAGLIFLTAWHSLMTRGNLKSGERVLVVGASGGVNTASIQIAKYIGAEVFVVGSNREKLDLAESLGADFTIDRSEEENWDKAAYTASHREGMDIVVDNVGAGSMPLSLRALRRGGRVLTVGNTGGPKFEIDNRFIFGKHLSIIGSTMGTNDDFATVMDLVFTCKLKPVIDRAYALEETPQAEDRLEAGEQMGKILIAIPS